MNRFVNFVIWPAVGGLVFGLVLLQLPRMAEYIPGLEAYLPKESVEQITVNSFSYAEAISKAAPGVVSINSTTDFSRRPSTPIFNPLTRRPLLFQDESTNLGSGVIISSDGYIITSFHIFELKGTDIVGSAPPTIDVTLYDGRVIQAGILAIEENYDLALLKVDETDLPYLTPADEYTLDAGDIVLAIGNPRNIGQSVTLGIISALLTSEDSYVIQTDASINPGNSGGALIDVDGRLIGINSTIVSESGGSEGISFAIPASRAFDLMETYIDQGPGGFIGVDGTFRSRLANRMFYDIDARGLLVERVYKGGPADKAGVQANDILTRIHDVEISSEEASLNAIKLISSMKPDETIIVEVNRAGQSLSISIALGVGEAILYLSEESSLDPSPFPDNLLR